MSKSKGKVIINAERCKGCGLCISVCRNQALQLSQQTNPKGFRPICICVKNNCNACKLCAVICPDTAIEVYKRKSKGR